MRKKAWVFYFVLIVSFACISVHLGGIAYNNIRLAGVGEASRTITVATVRGTIYDRNLIPLVNAENEYRAALLPDEGIISQVRGAMTNRHFLRMLEQLESGAPTVARLTKPVALVDGLRLFLAPVRYEKQVLAAHLLGYLDSSGVRGLTGIEAAFDDVLSSYNGKATVTFAVNGAGNYLQKKPLSVTNTLADKTGGVVLTLDSTVQQAADECGEYIEKGAIVVLDPYSGAIVASASFPTFHPERVADSIAADNGALVNRAFGLYDCGSVFKMVTAAAALESGVTPAQDYTCSGSMTVGNTVFHCHNRLGHQTLDMGAAFAQSCNLYFIQLAQQIGGEAILRTAESLGLRDRIVPVKSVEASAGVFPTERELLVPAALANFSFGQGKLLLSPLHVARMTAAIANGGYLPSLHLLSGFVDKEGSFSPKQATGGGESVLSDDTVSALQDMMRRVVTEGTGQKAAVEGCGVAGKTGTAQTGQVNGVTPVVQSWFTGSFVFGGTEYVVTVLIEDAEISGKSATAATCEFINKLAKKEKERTD